MISRELIISLSSELTLEVVLLVGPRQVGKSTLLEQFKVASHLVLDDLGLRERVQSDPALVLEGTRLPVLVDEAQYAPNLFSEIKLRVDKKRREQRSSGANSASTMFYLTGSNRTLLDEKVKESLSGRSHIFFLLGLSVSEILAWNPKIPLGHILFCGGYPELYVRERLKPVHYLNDYILTFVEKDIAISAGVEKMREFHTVLRLLAARTGQFINFSEVANSANVDQKTVQAWVSILQRNLLIELVPTFSSNLSKRIIKMPKLYFYDTGLCARLQGHTDEDLLWHSNQVGSLFETLVFTEIKKTILNHLLPWEVFTWRTKEHREIDFVIQTPKGILLIEAKLGIHNIGRLELDSEAKKVFKTVAKKLVVTAGGEKVQLDSETQAVPISQLSATLLETK